MNYCTPLSILLNVFVGSSFIQRFRFDTLQFFESTHKPILILFSFQWLPCMIQASLQVGEIQLQQHTEEDQQEVLFADFSETSTFSDETSLSSLSQTLAVSHESTNSLSADQHTPNDSTAACYYLFLVGKAIYVFARILMNAAITIFGMGGSRRGANFRRFLPCQGWWNAIGGFGSQRWCRQFVFFEQ